MAMLFIVHIEGEIVMRCVHCGKEVRDNVIFCIHCNRPVKREYSHYACEIYDSLSIRDKLMNMITKPSSQKEKYRQDISSKKYITAEKSLKNTIKSKGDSVKDLYNSYVNENDPRMKSSAADTGRSRPSGDETAAYAGDNDQDPEYFGMKDLIRFKESVQKNAQHAAKRFSDGTPDEKKNTMKIAGLVLALLVAFISACVDTNTNNYSYEESGTVYEDYYNDYAFPEEPVLKPEIIKQINSSPLGSESLITEYLSMLYDDTYQMQWFDEPQLYSLEAFEPYMDEIEQIEADYNNNPNYAAYDELIYIKQLWQKHMQPVYDNPENYGQWKNSGHLEEFSYSLDSVCNGYLEE